MRPSHIVNTAIGGQLRGLANCLHLGVRQRIAQYLPLIETPAENTSVRCQNECTHRNVTGGTCLHSEFDGFIHAVLPG
jgi:hypothetical protein